MVMKSVILFGISVSISISIRPVQLLCEFQHLHNKIIRTISEEIGLSSNCYNKYCILILFSMLKLHSISESYFGLFFEILKISFEPL